MSANINSLITANGHRYTLFSYDIQRLYGADFALALGAVINHYSKMLINYPKLKEFFYTEKQMRADIGLSYYKRKKFFKKATELGLMSVVTKGLPQRDHITLDLSKLQEFIKNCKSNSESLDWDEIDRMFGSIYEMIKDEPSKNSSEYPRCEIPIEDVEIVVEYATLTKTDIKDEKKYKTWCRHSILNGKYENVQEIHRRTLDAVFDLEIEKVENSLDVHFRSEKEYIESRGEKYRFVTTKYIMNEDAQKIFVATYTNEKENINIPISKSSFMVATKKILKTLHTNSRERIHESLLYQQKKYERRRSRDEH